MCYYCGYLKYNKQEKRTMEIDIDGMGRELDELLANSENVHRVAEEKYQTLEEIAQELELKIGDLRESLNHLYEVQGTVIEIEDLLSRAEGEDIYA